MTSDALESVHMHRFNKQKRHGKCFDYISFDRQLTPILIEGIDLFSEKLSSLSAIRVNKLTTQKKNNIIVGNHKEKTLAGRLYGRFTTTFPW